MPVLYCNTYFLLLENSVFAFLWRMNTAFLWGCLLICCSKWHIFCNLRTNAQWGTLIPTKLIWIYLTLQMREQAAILHCSFAKSQEMRGYQKFAVACHHLVQLGCGSLVISQSSDTILSLRVVYCGFWFGNIYFPPYHMHATWWGIKAPKKQDVHMKK